MKLGIGEAISALKPGAKFILRGTEYSGIEWKDDSQTKPTEDEVIAKLAELNYQEEINVYQEKRKLEYPQLADQLDKIYHTSLTAWKEDIKAIKDKYPKQTMDSTELQNRKDAAINDVKKTRYLAAVERLNEPEVALGKKVLIADNYWDPEQNKVIEGTKYTYIDIPDPTSPAVVKDEEQRDAAQATIDATPQSIIDSINT